MIRAASKADRSRTSAAFVLSRLGVLLGIVTLAGCGTFSERTGDPYPGSDAPRKRGGYYLDDGPGDNVPADLDSIPDAVPRVEPLHRGASRPYVVMGKRYTPMAEPRPYRERGIATWYGRRYHGQRTSSGEVYDMYAMTGAHPLLPIPSFARVTNVGNGRSVVVRINDRGPFLADRLIDLSYAAAHRLDIVRNGSAMVEVEAVFPDADAPFASRAAEPAETPPSEAAAASPAPSTSGSYYLQLAAFSVQENAQRFIERIRFQLGEADTQLSIVNSDSLFRIHAGPYASRAAALQAAHQMGQALGAVPIVTGPR